MEPISDASLFHERNEIVQSIDSLCRGFRHSNWQLKDPRKREDCQVSSKAEAMRE